MLVFVLGGMLQCTDADRSTPVARFRNLLLISIDTCRADHLGCYGYGRPTTPNIDALASEAVVFDNAMAPVPITLPSHCTMLTGTNPPHHGVHDNLDYQLGPDHVTLAELLKGQGFVTGAVISAKVIASRYGLAQGFDRYLETFDSEKSEVGIPQRIGGETNREALRWLEANHNEPFFLFLHYYDPHMMYEPPEPFATQYRDHPYAGEIAYVDRCIGEVVQSLKQAGVFDQTLIIITSDHGELLGEHGEQTHSYFVYHNALRVPLIIRLPGQGRGVRVDQLTGIVDIVPTVCALAGIDPPADLHGHDLSGFFDGGALPPDDRYVYCESLYSTKYDTQGLLGLVVGDWKYIQTTRPELYDLARDPAEARNLAAQEQDRAARMRQRLRELLDDQLRREADQSRLRMDPAEINRLRSLGYVADASVQEIFSFDPVRDDPKDVIDFHSEASMLGHLHHTNRHVDAERLCLQLLKVRPQFIAVQGHLGQALLAQGRSEEAIPHFRAVLEVWRDPERQHLISRSMAGGVSSGLGSAHRQKGRLDQAGAAFRESIEIWPESTRGHLGLARVLVAHGRTADAEPHLRRALELNPSHSAAHHLLAKVLRKSGRKAEAQHHGFEARNPQR